LLEQAGGTNRSNREWMTRASSQPNARRPVQLARVSATVGLPGRGCLEFRRCGPPGISCPVLSAVLMRRHR
jgi:hypothetical protein